RRHTRWPRDWSSDVCSSDLVEWQKINGYPFSLLTEASVNLADDDELLGNMQDAGFRRVFLGIETPVEESLKEAQKSQNRGNLLRSEERRVGEECKSRRRKES